MATPEQPVASRGRPSASATLAAAGQGTVAAAHAAIAPSVIAAEAQARAIAEATTDIISALAAFAQGREATIIPALQHQLVETFVNRTPAEIAKLLGQEASRERMFLRRQAARMERDLPKVLAEADVAKRREAMDKLMAREQRYIAQRERAMAARAHSVVDSLDLEEASPEGAFWRLGKVSSQHTPGCLAMANRFWPWPVLRNVIHPPVHPGCACHLISFQEAVAKGLMKPTALPDLADALTRARRNLALEEALYELVPHEEAIVELVEEELEEAKKHKGGQQQLRYAKGLAKGGEFMPKTGADMKTAKGLLDKLGLKQRGADRGRHVWLRGHHTWVPEDRAFARTLGGVNFHSPAGSTLIYRNGELVGAPREPPQHADLEPPAGGEPAAPLIAGEPLPASDEALAAAREELQAQIEHRLQQPKKGPPISPGDNGKAAHDALLASGFVVRAAHSSAGPNNLRVAYTSKSGHQLSLATDRKTGKVVGTKWKADPMGGWFDNEWKELKAGREPQGFKGDTPGEWDYGKGPKPAGGHTGGSGYKSATYSGGGSGPGWGGSSYKPSAPKPPPLPPVVHEARLEAPAPKGPIPNWDHVELTVKGGTADPKYGTAADGSKWALKTSGGNEDRVAAELLSNAIYRALGANVPEAGVRHIDDDEPDFASIPDIPLDEPPLPGGPGTRISTGIIIRNAAGEVTIFEPKNHYMGYEHTFPKGGLEHGLTSQQNAHKELWEETGLHARITGVVGDYPGQSGISRYYEGVLTGGEVTLGDETWSVKTVSPEEAAKLLNKERDQNILADVLELPLPGDEVFPDTFPPPVGERAAVAYPLAEGKVTRIKEPNAELGKHFMADALLGNWEFLGKHGDEVVMGADGKPIREDQGGTLQFRENGGVKPFGPVPTEVWSMLGPKGQGFGTVKVSDAQKRQQAAAIAKKLTPAKLDAMVEAAPFRSGEMREEIRQALHGRVEWMARYANGEEHEPAPLSGADAGEEMGLSQQGLRLFPEQESALHMLANEGAGVDEHLRSGAAKDKASDEERFVIRELDGLFNHVETEDDVTAFAAFDPAAVLGDKAASELVGKTMTNKSYLGLGLDESAVRKANAGVLEVLIPQGSAALYTRGIPGVSVDDQQPDVLTERGSRLRIVGQTKKGGKVHIQAVLLP